VYASSAGTVWDESMHRFDFYFLLSNQRNHAKGRFEDRAHELGNGAEALVRWLVTVAQSMKRSEPETL